MPGHVIGHVVAIAEAEVTPATANTDSAADGADNQKEN